MIDRIEGKVLELEPTHVVIDVGGVAFFLSITVQTYEGLGRAKRAMLFTHLYVREDALQLFGFQTPGERESFKILISISGVGPKVARAILSSVSVRTLRDSVSLGDWKRLTAAPGVGRKLAERMVIELRDKLPQSDNAIEPDSGNVSGYAGRAGSVREAVEALVTLGHSQLQAEKLVTRAAKKAGEDAGVEDLLKAALSS
ncbi:MAG TPA: Holliday junction branch migration protein RuvA [Bacteroidetes bacterium]|nr:Holliday junction branch migration protein RuvA [Bacteroidota bacterium]HEX03826.1 Holliday junction branch migration protein RuvA [Bacteroidota bacterium]